MNKPLFNYVAGTGGIGIGRFFELEGNHTLGRNESRLAHFTEYRDYCKLHIILHYVAVFLRGEIPVYAIGHVGRDDEGKVLKKEMEKAGINVSHVSEDSKNPTMYSICCQYPDGEGFNVTANNSACRTVGRADVDRFFNETGAAGQGIVIAAPEVPLETRIHLLKKGKEKLCFNFATVLSGEAEEFAENDGVSMTDLIALNMDEAFAFASLSKQSADTDDEKITGCINYLKSFNPEITVIITLGGKGAVGSKRDLFYRSEAVNAPVISTAGAGDCFLGTMAAAMIRGIDILPQKVIYKNQVCAMDLGILTSGKKITCKDTIDFSMTPESLLKFALDYNFYISDEVKETFFNTQENAN